MVSIGKAVKLFLASPGKVGIQNIREAKAQEKSSAIGQSLSSAGVTQTTPRTTTGDYVTSGGTVSVSSSGKVTTTSNNSGGGGSSGGGGGSSSRTTTSSVGTTPTSSQTLALDTPSSYPTTSTGKPLSVVSAYNPPTANQTANYFKTNIKSDPFGTIAGVGKIGFSKVKTGVTRVWNKATDKTGRDLRKEQEAQQLIYGLRTEPTSMGQGTDITYNKDYTQEEVVKGASIGKYSEEATQKFLVNKAEEKINTQKEFDLKVPKAEIISQGQLESNANYNALLAQVQSGIITTDKANELLLKSNEEINNKVNEKISNLESNWNKTTGKELISQEEKNINKQLDKIKINQGITTGLAVGLATGGIGGAIAGSSAVGATVVKTAGQIGLGVGALSTGKYLVENVGTGNLTPSRIGAILIPQIAFLGGAVVGGAVGYKVVGGATKIDSVKLNTALENSKIVVKDTKAITTESQLKSYKLPEEIGLNKEIKSGNSIRITKYDIKGSTSEYQKLIDQAMPKREIISYEVTDTLGNVIGRKFIVVEKVSGGGRKFIDYQTGESMGIYDKNLNIIAMETAQIKLSGTGKGKNLKPVEASKQLEIISDLKSKYILEDGQIKRISVGKTSVFEGKKITAEPKKAISYKDLQEVVNSEMFKKIPSSKGASREVQDLVGIKIDTASITKQNKDLTLSGLGLKETTLKFKTEFGKGYSENIPKPINFEKITTKKMKPFQESFDLNKEINNLLKKESKATTKKLPVQELEIPKQTLNELESSKQLEVPSYDFSKDILKNVQKQSEKYAQKRSVKFEQGFGVSTIPLLDLSQVQAKRLKQSDIFKTNIFSGQIQPQKISQEQILSQRYSQQLSNIDYVGITNPTIPKPVIPKPINPVIPIPMLPAFRWGGAGSKVRKFKIPKSNTISKYTASLGAAAFQKKGIKVTKKQLDALNKKTFSGFEARGLLEIVPEKDLKSIKKGLKKVNF